MFTLLKKSDADAVRQVVTFAMPHDKLGEDVAAAVVLRDGASATEKEIREFAEKDSRVTITADQHIGVSNMFFNGLDEKGNEVIFTAYGKPLH